MPWFQTQIKQRDALLSPLFSVSLSSSASPPPLPSTFPKQQSTPSSSSSSSSKISPAVLFIIIILALVFFIAGLLHLLVRFLLKKRSSSSLSQSNRYPEMATPDAYDRQLQQLFHLHDSGLDQAFVDALPVFLYKDIVGLKEPFDCAVCLCEFSPNDKLRLLPLCSHAFHIDCIDTWLLSNSTCPLCRGTLFTPGFSIENPVFDFDDRIEEDGFLAHGLRGENDIEKRVFSVRLGKFRTLNGDNGGERKEGETSRSNLDARRCFSMGSCQYVVANSDLQVALCPNRENGRGGILKGRGGHNVNSGILGDNEGKRINIGSKNESFSVSKIWLWSRKDKSDNHMSNSSVNVSLPRRTEKALAR